MAKAMAEGKNDVSFAAEDIASQAMARRQNLPLRNPACLYAHELARIQQRFPNIDIVPTIDDMHVLERGKRLLSEHAHEKIGNVADLFMESTRLIRHQPTRPQ